MALNYSSRDQATAALAEFLSDRGGPLLTTSQRRIVAAFLRLAGAHGFESVTMRTLSRELGLKAPSLYSSFPGGREEIVAEVLLGFRRRFALGLLAAVQATAGPEEYWAALVRFHLVQHLKGLEADLGDLLVATDKVSRFFSEEVRQEISAWLRLREAMFVASAQDMGYPLSRQTAHVILTLLDGAGRWAAWNGGEPELQVLVDRTVALSRSILEIGSGVPT